MRNIVLEDLIWRINPIFNRCRGFQDLKFILVYMLSMFFSEILHLGVEFELRETSETKNHEREFDKICRIVLRFRYSCKIYPYLFYDSKTKKSRVPLFLQHVSVMFTGRSVQSVMGRVDSVPVGTGSRDATVDTAW